MSHVYQLGKIPHPHKEIKFLVRCPDARQGKLALLSMGVSGPYLWVLHKMFTHVKFFHIVIQEFGETVYYMPNIACVIPNQSYQPEVVTTNLITF